MINLLADNLKSEIKAARVNVITLRYIWLMLLAATFIGVVFWVTYSSLSQTEANAEKIISSNDIKASVYSDTRQQVQALSSQLSETRTVLDQEFRFSKLLVDIGQILPSGTILDSLPLDTTKSQTSPTQLKVFAKTAADAVTLQEKLKSSSLFSSLSIQSTSESGGISGYPVVITMTVSFNKAGS